MTFRWTRERASIALPLEGASSEARLKLRLARFLPGSARVRVFVDGAPAGAFSARSGRFRTVDRPIVLPAGSSTLSFLVEDPDPETPRGRHRLDTHRERSLAPAARRPSAALAPLRRLRARARLGLFPAARARDRRLPRLRPGYMVRARPFRDGPRPPRDYRRRARDDSSSRRRFEERSLRATALSARVFVEGLRVVSPELLLPGCAPPSPPPGGHADERRKVSSNAVSPLRKRQAPLTLAASRGGITRFPIPLFSTCLFSVSNRMRAASNRS